jgi:amidase
MTDPALLSARQQAALIRRGKIGCLELLDHYLDRIARHDGRINAVVARNFERGRARAKRLDRNGNRGCKLFGVPMTVKESFDVTGLPTTWGLAEKRGQIAATDALAVQRLEAAGAVVFGKTNVPPMLGDWQSANPIYGVTNNPWDLARSPGGSSGGSAAALAAGLTGLELGSDIGGSIRQPAHACGLFGHKPSYGLLPTRGHGPDPSVAGSLDIAVIGPLARSADDLALALGLLAQPDPLETALRVALPAPAATSFKGLRVAVWPSDPVTETDAEISDGLAGLAQFLRGQGAKVSLTARPAFDARQGFAIALQMLGAALSIGPPGSNAGAIARAEALAPDDRSANACFTRGAALRHSDFLGLNERRHRLRREWAAFFRDWDVILTPAFASPALPHIDTPLGSRVVAINGRTCAWNDMLFWPLLAGAVHLPATAAPLGQTHAGLPFGMQIIGPLHGDRTTIAVAQLLEKSWRGFVPPPGWC